MRIREERAALRKCPGGLQGPSAAAFSLEQAHGRLPENNHPTLEGIASSRGAGRGTCVYRPDWNNVQFVVTGERAQKALPQ